MAQPPSITVFLNVTHSPVFHTVSNSLRPNLLFSQQIHNTQHNVEVFHVEVLHQGANREIKEGSSNFLGFHDLSASLNEGFLENP